jgi:hypothetical protein
MVPFFQTEVTMQFQSSQDLATQAAKQLIHALLNPQRAAPFCQVEDDQMLALGLVAAIFEGALPPHKTIMASPQGEIPDSDIPPRVKMSVPPPRVPNTATPPRVVQDIVTNIATPKSNVRLNPTPSRAVTPYTPHLMIR